MAWILGLLFRKAHGRGVLVVVSSSNLSLNLSMKGFHSLLDSCPRRYPIPPERMYPNMSSFLGMEMKSLSDPNKPASDWHCQEIVWRRAMRLISTKRQIHSATWSRANQARRCNFQIHKFIDLSITMPIPIPKIYRAVKFSVLVVTCVFKCSAKTPGEMGFLTKHHFLKSLNTLLASSS